MIGPARAALYPLRGFAYLWRRPSLRRRAAVPLALNVLVFGAGLVLAWLYLDDLVRAVLPAWEGGWGRAAYLAALVLAWAAALAGGAFLFATVGNLLSGPFHESLSSAVERCLADEGRGAFPVERPAPLVRGALEEAGKLALLATVAAPLALLGLVLPPAGALLACFLAWFCGFEFLEIPLARRGVPLGGRLRASLGRGPATLAFGATATALLAVPGLNLAALPACVVGGTLLYRLEWGEA